MRHLLAVEALVAAQAVDLRGASRLGTVTQQVFDAVRSVVTPLQIDRPCGPDAMDAHDALFADSMARALRMAVREGMAGFTLRGV